MLRPHVAIGFLLASACTRMQQVEPQAFIPHYKPLQVSVWTAPDSMVIVANPTIVEDSLVGAVFGERWGTPLKNVLRVEATAPDHARTALLLGAVAASVVGVFVISGTGSKTGGIPCPPDGCDTTNGPPP